jgi:hypothetical protein
MADKSESLTKGINLNLGKTFESGLNIGFDAFLGETTEKGKYNVAPKKKKIISGGIGATTEGGYKWKLDVSKSKAQSTVYFPERTEKSVILSFSKQFNKGGEIVMGKNIDKDLL